MGSAQTIVILGGGVGGLIAATELRKHISAKHRVLLVDREPEHLFAPSLLWLMVGLRKSKSIKRPLKRLERKGIDVLLGEIEHIDPQNREVKVNGALVRADHLIVALGAELAPELVSGLNEAGHNFYTLAGATNLHTDLQSLKHGRVVVLTAAPVYKCPAAPYEGALLIDAFLRKRHLRGAVEVAVYAAEAGPMGVAGPELSAAVKQLLEAKGVPYHPNHQVKSVDRTGRQIEFANGVKTSFDVLAYVPPHRAPRVVRESALASNSGWISVDKNSMATAFPGVYAIGDVVSIPLKMGKPLPTAGVFAHGEAEVA